MIATVLHQHSVLKVAIYRIHVSGHNPTVNINKYMAKALSKPETGTVMNQAAPMPFTKDQSTAFFDLCRPIETTAPTCKNKLPSQYVVYTILYL